MKAGEPALVGRADELDAIARLVDALAVDGTGAVLQVAGQPGIGKSRLLSELRLRARERGQLVLSGRAAEFEAELPFGVFGDALDDWLVALEPERRQALAGGLADELAVVLPAFEVLAPRRAPAVDQERYRSYRAVRTLLSALAADAPVVLVLDDVHWADPGSVELLGHLLAHPPRGEVLIALGFRPAQLSPQLTVALGTALRDQHATRLDLAPLSREAAGELLDPGLASAQRDQLYRDSGGNPFFLLQLARVATLAARRPGAGSGTLASSVPETVRAALTSELSSLSAPSLVLLQGAAVTGDPFEAAMAARAADIGAADAMDLVDELVRFQLVYPTAVAGQFAFRHPIVRATVYELAAGGWRARAHARVAALLAARNAGPSAQAPHVERSAVSGDAGAVTVLVAAAVASAPRAPALAARWYAAALRLLPESAAGEPRRVELLVAMATALGGSGQLEASRHALCEVLDRLPADDPGRVPVVAYCAGVEHLLGRHRDADARLLQSYGLHEQRGSAEAVQLEIEIAAGHGYQNRHEDMLSWAQRAVEGAQGLGLGAAEVAAAGQIALARYFLGLPTADAIARAADGFDALDDVALASRLDLGLWVGWTESVLERHDDAIAHCQRVLRVARATGLGAALLVTMTAQAWSLIRVGRLAEADELLTGAIEAGRLAPNLFLAVAAGLSCVIATQRGDLAAAVRTGEESVRLARSADPGLIPGMAGLYLGIALIELGEARRARESVLATSRGGEPATSRSGHTQAYEVLTRAELALGNIDAAREWARKAEASTHGGELAGEAAFARRATVAVVLAQGDPARAAQIALAAAARADAAGIPAEAGRCRILAARALVAEGRRADAIAELEHAVEQLGRIGADGYRDEAEKQLRRLGRRTARRASAPQRGLEALTERERDVAELVRQGRTNREIAAAIYVSEKTVERHLSRIFAKLGVSSRTVVALVVAGEDGPA